MVLGEKEIIWTGLRRVLSLTWKANEVARVESDQENWKGHCFVLMTRHLCFSVLCPPWFMWGVLKKNKMEMITVHKQYPSIYVLSNHS